MSSYTDQQIAATYAGSLDTEARCRRILARLARERGRTDDAARFEADAETAETAAAAHRARWGVA